MFGIDEEDDFLAAPSIGEALWGNKLKALLLLGGVYAAGAVIGRQRSGQALTAAGGMLAQGGRKAANFAGDKLATASKAGSGYYDRPQFIAEIMQAKPQQVDLQLYLSGHGIGLDEYYQYLSQAQGFTGNPLAAL